MSIKNAALTSAPVTEAKISVRGQVVATSQDAAGGTCLHPAITAPLDMKLTTRVLRSKDTSLITKHGCEAAGVRVAVTIRAGTSWSDPAYPTFSSPLLRCHNYSCSALSRWFVTNYLLSPARKTITPVRAEDCAVVSLYFRHCQSSGKSLLLSRLEVYRRSRCAKSRQQIAMSTDRGDLEKIISGFLSGDSRQYDVVQRHIARLVTMYYFGSRDERNDLVSAIVETLYRNLQNRVFQGDSVRALNAYIYTIAKRQIIKSIEQSRRDRPPFTRRIIPESIGRYHDNPGGIIADREYVTKIFAALDERCRELLLLKFQRGWSDSEIAEFMQKSKNAISTAISRCLKKAQKLKIVREFLYQNGARGH